MFRCGSIWPRAFHMIEGSCACAGCTFFITFVAIKCSPHARDASSREHVLRCLVVQFNLRLNISSYLGKTTHHSRRSAKRIRITCRKAALQYGLQHYGSWWDDMTWRLSITDNWPKLSADLSMGENNTGIWTLECYHCGYYPRGSVMALRAASFLRWIDADDGRHQSEKGFLLACSLA